MRGYSTARASSGRSLQQHSGPWHRRMTIPRSTTHPHPAHLISTTTTLRAIGRVGPDRLNFASQMDPHDGVSEMERLLDLGRSCAATQTTMKGRFGRRGNVDIRGRFPRPWTDLVGRVRQFGPWSPSSRFELHNESVLADELLAVLRPVIGVDQLEYADAPVKFAGGLFTENYVFRLTGAAGAWDRPLVVRLFPSLMRPEHVRCEVEAQRGVADQGCAAPRVLAFDEHSRLLGRRYLVMERVSGVPLMGDLDLGTVIRRGPRILTATARITAEVQARLHALDPAPVLAALEGTTITVERWFEFLGEQIDAGATGFVEPLRWLVDHRPADPGRLALCHGDLWGHNILVEGARVTGVLDWTTATVANPALDLGFTTMAVSLAPINATPAIQRIAARIGRGLARRYLRIYQSIAPVDLGGLPYYQALRAAAELASVADYRLGTSAPYSRDRPQPAWDNIAETVADYFRARTGVELRLPPRPP